MTTSDVLVPHHQLRDTYVYDDGLVYAEMVTDEDLTYATIYEFSSRIGGQGNARRALQYLRERFGALAAQGVGRYEDDASWTFWVKMARELSMECLWDDEGAEVQF